jgi:hypothetical protein
MKLTELEFAYLAGFIDGDGSIIAQIVKEEDEVYKHRIRVSVVFYQPKDKHWFMLWLKQRLKYGTLRIRNDGISEYTITGSNPVKTLLLRLKPYIKLKKTQLTLVLEILEKKQSVKSAEEFLTLCKLVDKTQTYTPQLLVEKLDSKN